MIGLPYPARWVLVHCLILPLRIGHVTREYGTIWTKEGSPLTAIGKKQCQKLREMLGCPVEIGYRYGNPSIQDAVESLEKQGCDKIIAQPLYPQYSPATTATTRKELERIRRFCSAAIEELPPFWQDENYLQALTETVRRAHNPEKAHLIVSFHGLPVSSLRKIFRSYNARNNRPICDICDIQTPKNTSTLSCPQHCYRIQSISIANHIASSLGVTADQFSIAWQSRMGPNRWLEPNICKVIQALVGRGVGTFNIVSPSFVTDCLETNYELGIDLPQKISALTAKKVTINVLPCLNEQVEWLAAIIQSHERSGRLFC